jgi:hypothetical protein
MISKNLKGATYGNPYQQPYAENEYSQNQPAPTGSGGGKPYVNPQDRLAGEFFDPKTPNDSTFSSSDGVSADPLDNILSGFSEAQSKMFNKGGR